MDYSKDEMLAVGDAILQDDRESGDDLSVVATYPSADMSELVVEVNRDAVPVNRTDRLEQAYDGGSVIPVAVRRVAADPPVPATRQNSLAPWKGGTALGTTAGITYCSTGFAITLANGEGRLVSAAHCNNLNDVVRDGVGDRIGVVRTIRADIDTSLIDPDASPATQGRVFGGPWNAPDTHARYIFDVVSAANPAQDQSLCTSGAMSGEHCDAIVRVVGVQWSCNGFTCEGTRLRRSNNGIVAARGDSGGPVYADPNRTDGDVNARGIISAVDTQIAPCPQTTAETTDCWSRVYVVGIRKILNSVNGNIETN